MNTPKLPPLPCPFCGNEPKVVDDLITFHVECTNCGSTGSVSSYESGAISEWNRRAAIEAQGVPDGLHLIVSGAIFDFAGFLTSSDEVIPVGGSAESAPMVDRIQSWAKKRGLSLKDAATLSWQHWLASAPPAPQSWPLPGWKVQKEQGNDCEHKWAMDDDHPAHSCCQRCGKVREPQAAVVQQEPLGFISPKQVERIVDPDGEFGADIPMRKTPAGNFTLAIYTHPAQQAKPQPLSDKEADRMTERFYLNGRPVPAPYRLSLVRATERHHGIKE